MISEERIVKNMKGSDRVLVVCDMLAFVWRYSHKQPRTSATLTGLQVDNGAPENEKQFRHT